jgi:hypothetical protein
MSVPDGLESLASVPPQGFKSYGVHHHTGVHREENAFRRVQRVSTQAALASKKKIWDSNAASIDAGKKDAAVWYFPYTPDGSK